MMVLDAVHAIQATQAPDLAVRWNCKAGKCGSCAAEINGSPRLMCMTRVDALAGGGPVTVTPMRAFPVLRDLVSDVAANYERLSLVPPFRHNPEAGDALRVHQADVERVQEFHNCIECFLCQDTCHVIRDRAKPAAEYGGPRVFVRLAALEMHPADTGERVAFAKEKAGLGCCNVTKCCTEVCPENIRITDNAIIPLKERAADRYYDPLARRFKLFSAD